MTCCQVSRLSYGGNVDLNPRCRREAAAYRVFGVAKLPAGARSEDNFAEKHEVRHPGRNQPNEYRRKECKPLGSRDIPLSAKIAICHR
jgi:hypothetical protein